MNEGEENIASMHNKFCPPCGNEYTVDLVSEIPPPPNYNLVILDVHMGFPAAAPEVTAAVAATGTAARRQSKASAAPQKPSIIPLAVDIQQVAIYVSFVLLFISACVKFCEVSFCITIHFNCGK